MDKVEEGVNLKSINYLEVLNDTTQIPIRNYEYLGVEVRYEVLNFQKKLNSYGDRVVVMLRKRDSGNGECFQYFLAPSYNTPSKVAALEAMLMKPDVRLMLYLKEVKRERSLIIPVIKFEVMESYAQNVVEL